MSTRKPYVEAPVIAGHEFIGEVVELGEGAAVKSTVSKSAIRLLLSRSCRVGSVGIAERGSIGFAKSTISTGFNRSSTVVWRTI